VVTGAGAGLGRAYALELARRGAKVLVNDLGSAQDGTGKSSSAADNVVEEIVAAGGEAVANYDSVDTPEGGENIVNQAVETWGRVDILINNAGILRDKTLVKMEPAMWEAVLGVHLKGAYNVTRPAFLKMREQRYGRIILTTSAAGLYGNFGQTNYSAAKLALVGFMNTLKIEGAGAGIKVNTVAPIAGTRLTEEVIPPDLFEKLKPEFVSPLVLYLASEQCPVTGAIYNAGGGYFNRVAVLTGPGKAVGDGKLPPTPEQVASAMKGIKSMADAQEYQDLNRAMTPMLDAFDPKKAAPKGEGEKEGGLTVPAVFEQMPDAFQVDAAVGVEVIFQFSISGPGGGEWHAEIQGGTCTVADGRHEQPTTTIKMNDEDFIALMSGSLNPMTAYTSGKLKIEGDIMKSQLIAKLFKF
jgi:NAD(P)-dependent dehydrogenase (short-subunit alcohol dehydrogenase family)/putative sterol carrier protein